MFFYKVLHKVAYWLFRKQIYGVTGIENLPKNDGVIIAANHGTAYDPFIIAVALRDFLRQNFTPRRKKIFYLGDTRIKYKFSNYFIAPIFVVLLGEKIGYLPANKKGLTRAVELLKAGHIVVIFPEGRQNPEQKLLRVRRGVFALAKESGKRIVPTGCFGGMAAIDYKEFFQSWRDRKSVVFGQSVFIDSMESENIGLKKIMAEIAKVSKKSY